MGIKLRVRDNLQIAGQVCLRLLERETGRVVREVTQRNMVTNTGLGLLASRLADPTAYDGQLSIIALGTAATAPGSGNTALGAEYVRVARYAASRSGPTITVSAFFAAATADCHVREVGVFGGAATAGVPGSGTLFARTLTDADNSAGLYDVSVDWTLSLARG